ncbi:E3 ubiquitin-protein ligase RNF103-like [Rhopilema esculentum]|uniref:E3 ubiquitin-protein ligase RNF103-like n=1 Tax=Rhopilema esculentum TaxID=499914 RepID=UPI0031E4227B|eukprot:gene12442-3111_t
MLVESKWIVELLGLKTRGKQTWRVNCCVIASFGNASFRGVRFVFVASSQTSASLCRKRKMLFRLTLVLAYCIIIFVGARLVDVSVSLIEVTSLTLLCKLLPSALFSEYFCGGVDAQQQDTHPHTEEKSENISFLNESNPQSEDTSLKETQLGTLDGKSIDFTSYDHFIENVEDTKASVWVVWVRPSQTYGNKHDKSPKVRSDQCGKNETVLAPSDWTSLSYQLLKYGIRTGTYRCAQDTKLCKKHNIKACSILLSMPAGTKPKGRVATYLYKNKSSCSVRGNEMKGKLCLLEWIKSKLKSKVVILNKFEELSSVLRNSKKGNAISSQPNLNIVFESGHKIPPLLLSALSVRFTGRIRFVHMKRKKEYKPSPNKNPSLYAVTSSSNYSYGSKQGENFDYSNIDIFLRTLYPEANDIFLLALTLINMSCLLELFVQKGGPLKRLICFSWIAVLSNSLLIFVWLPILRLLQLPETVPIVEFFLKSLQAIMFSDVAALVRKDFLVLSQHVGVFAIGLIMYGSAVGYIQFILSNRGLPRPTLTSLWNDDVNEIREFFHSLLSLATPPLFYFELEERLENLLQRLSVPDLWLHPLNSNEFVKHLICWKFCKNSKFTFPLDQKPSKPILQDKMKSKHCKCQNTQKRIPYFALPSFDCVVCLENYSCGDIVKLLPCGHFFHKGCIDSWLLQSLEVKNRSCPVCRWPANKQKNFVAEQDVL